MRLNTITIGYLKELPVEHFSDTLYDIVVNEVNGNFEEEYDIVESMDDLLKLNFYVYQFMLEINNGGYINFFNSDAAAYYTEIIEALHTIEAEETMQTLIDAVRFIKSELVIDDEELTAALQSKTLYELDENEDIVFELKELDERLKMNEEPVADYLVKMIKENVRGRDDEEEI